MKDSLFVPLFQAIATGAFLAAAAWGFSARLWFVFIFACATLIAWSYQMRRYYRYKFPIDEPVEVEYYSKNLNLSVSYERDQVLYAKSWIHITGVTEEEFITWCNQVTAGSSLGENHWCGSGNLFSKSVYIRFRDLMERRGFVQAKGRHHSQGFELTDLGQAVLSHVANRSTSPTWQPSPSLADLLFGNLARERERAPEDLAILPPHTHTQPQPEQQPWQGKK